MPLNLHGLLYRYPMGLAQESVQAMELEICQIQGSCILLADLWVTASEGRSNTFWDEKRNDLIRCQVAI